MMFTERMENSPRCKVAHLEQEQRKQKTGVVALLVRPGKEFEAAVY
jgi:hypothetical protein